MAGVEQAAEAEARALEHLARIAVKLEESGLLDIIEALADEKVVESLSRILVTTSTLRLLDNIDNLLGLLEALADAASKQPEPLGLTGLLDALRDPDVQRGLGVLVNVLRALGAARAPGST